MTEVFGLSRRLLLAGVVCLCASIGCTDAKMSSKPAAQPAAVTQHEPAKKPAADDKPAAEKPEADEVLAARNKLSPEDRKLVDAQEWCVISNDERLGGMGTPIKLTIKGETVFICCGGCKKTAEANPDKTLAKAKELKAKKAAADKKS